MLIPLRFLLFFPGGSPAPSTPGTVPEFIPVEPTNQLVCVTVDDLVEALQMRLGDTSGQLWTMNELAQYVTEGYNALTLATGCLWATEVAPDYAFASNHSQSFEAEFIEGGNDLAGPAQFTCEFERDYINYADGPANHNHHWEFNSGYVEESGAVTEVSAMVDLPEDLYEIERATWNSRRLATERSRYFENDDSRYELSKGEVEAYTQDKDGLRRLRKWRVPSAAFIPREMDDDSEEFGILVDISDIDADTPLNTWGDFVHVAGEDGFGDPWGIIVGVYSDTSNLRYEYRRRGVDLSIECFEIPSRYVTYVRHYAQARALEREGDGQDLDLAAHYDIRYAAGVARMLKRQQAMSYQKKYVMGGSPKMDRRLPLARLPWAYGKVVR